MSLVLNIDTSTDGATINIADSGKTIIEKNNSHQKNHSSFVEIAIREISQESTIQLNDLSAIAVVAGPGSYTGLRIGMASAKALCYALQKPLISMNKLEVLALAAVEEVSNEADKSSLYCSMIDARRMEVFTAVYDNELKEVLSPCAMILNEKSFIEILEKNKVFFFGNGSAKWDGTYNHKNALLINVTNEGNSMARLSHKMLYNQIFSDVAYATPLYIKEFFSGPIFTK